MWWMHGYGYWWEKKNIIANLVTSLLRLSNNDRSGLGCGCNVWCTTVPAFLAALVLVT